MRNLTQVLKENNVTEERLYNKFLEFQKYNNKNRNFGMSMRMAFSDSERFVLAALGLNYLEDALINKLESPKQMRLFQ